MHSAYGEQAERRAYQSEHHGDERADPSKPRNRSIVDLARILLVKPTLAVGKANNEWNENCTLNESDKPFEE